MWTRELLKRNAKEIFKRNYWTCVGVSLVLAALTGGGSSVIGRIGGNNTSVSYHHYGSDYYYGDSARGFMISMVKPKSAPDLRTPPRSLSIQTEYFFEHQNSFLIPVKTPDNRRLP